jgi:hypothetical protein
VDEATIPIHLPPGQLSRCLAAHVTSATSVADADAIHFHSEDGELRRWPLGDAPVRTAAQQRQRWKASGVCVLEAGISQPPLEGDELLREQSQFLSGQPASWRLLATTGAWRTAPCWSTCKSACARLCRTPARGTLARQLWWS